MRPRVVAASAATLIAAASLSPVVAQAAGQNTIYVNSGDSTCSDSGSGSIDAPFCSIQAAADVANPGDVVIIAAGAYASGAVITRSGTASDPIVFTGGPNSGRIGEGSTATSELTLSGASNVEVEDLDVYSGTSAAVTVSGGSDDTIANINFESVSSTGGPSSVLVTGGASATTVRDSYINEGIAVEDGATGTVVTTNEVQADGTPVVVQGATDTAVTSNTVLNFPETNCDPGISVSGSSAGTSVENNVVDVEGSCAAGTPYGVQVDASSATGTTLDYNDVYAGTTGTAYSWNGASYSSAAALYAATQQGRHDYNGADGDTRTEHSPIINSANSAAIGEQALDIDGNARTFDPVVTPTGAGPYNDYDRGAFQFQDPYTAAPNASYTLSATKVPVGTTITAHAVLADTWGDSFGSYEFYFGGNAAPLVTSVPTATWTPTVPGDYWTAVVGAAPGSSTYNSLNGLAEGEVDVVQPQPLVAKEALSSTGALGVLASDSGTTDEWNIGSVTFDFGDGTPAQTVADGAQAQHTYAEPGTYTVTETVTDLDGNTATTSSAFTTKAPAAGTLGIVQGVGAAPAGSTGIAQAASTAVNSSTDMCQILAVTKSGQAELALGDMNLNWQAWQALSQPGVMVKWVGIAGMPNGSSQLVEVTSTGELLHTVRNANGSWQGGWGSPAGSSGFVNASITAMPDGSSQLVAVTTGGVVMHNIRYANGSWQGWRALTQPGVKVVDASIAGMPNGSSQIVEVTSGDVMKHNIRLPNGAWQPQGWGSPAGATGITQVSISSMSVFGTDYGPGATTEATTISAVTVGGGQESVSRNQGGSWTEWSGTTSGIGNLGTAANTTLSVLPDGSELVFIVTGG